MLPLPPAGVRAVQLGGRTILGHTAWGGGLGPGTHRRAPAAVFENFGPNGIMKNVSGLRVACSWVLLFSRCTFP
jgi:hypothetical protein